MPGPTLRRACAACTLRAVALGISLTLAAGILAMPRPARAQARAVVLDLPLYQPELGQAAVPAYHPRQLVIELAPGTPRPGFGAARRLTPPGRPVALEQGPSGMAALDRVHAAHRIAGWEPLFPAAVPPAAGAPGEDLTRFYVVHLPADGVLAAALADYADVPGVMAAEPVGIFPVAYTPNDPQRNLQYWLGQASDRDSDVYEAWDVFRGDSSIVVAIVDTGVQYNHEDLGGTAAPYTAGVIATNFIELAGTPGVDDDGNGFIDDYRGWDFVGAATGVPGEDLGIPDNEPTDFVGHGTFCSGMASARTDNGVGIAGTAFRAKILPVRVGWADGVSPGGVVQMTYCAQAIQYATAMGAHVINCSWSNNNNGGLGAAVNNAIAQGLVVCVAAGNGNTSLQGSNHLSTRGDCVDVAATTAADVRASFSNYGPWVDVAAAGVNNYSTSSSAYTPGYATGSGTSYSSPLVAGAVALYQGHRRSLGQPLASPSQVLLRLRDTGDDIDALNPAFAGLLGTRLNVHRLLTDPPTSWLNVVGGAMFTSPAVADLDGDGLDEVVIGASDQRILAVRPALGDTLPGWPVAVGASVTSSPAIWDVDLDGEPEVVVATDGGRVYAIDGDGSVLPGWPVQLAGVIYGGPAVGDLDPAPGLECVVATGDSVVAVIDRHGTVRPGWPVKLGGPMFGIPALHDLDGDGYDEIAVGAYDSTLYVLRHDGSAHPGWPQKLDGFFFSSPAIGDLDADGTPEIVVGCTSSKVYAFRPDGSAPAGWPVTVAGGARSSPALADLAPGDGGRLEVAIASDGPTLSVIRHDGTFAPGWPRALGGPVSGGVAVGDVDGDGLLDVVVGARDRKLYIFRADGQEKAGWPRTYDNAISGGPTLADPDRDGRLEILFGTEGRRLRAEDMGPMTYDASRLPWPTMHRDPFRRGSVVDLVVSAPGVPGRSGAGGLALAAAPNPSRGAVRLRATRAAAAGAAPLEVAIVSLAGRRMRGLSVPVSDGGVAATWTWDGRDDAGRAVPPGLYFVRARWGGEEARLRIVRLD